MGSVFLLLTVLLAPGGDQARYHVTMHANADDCRLAERMIMRQMAEVAAGDQLFTWCLAAKHGAPA